MKKKIQIKDESIETAGICRDYKEALCEYIWNAFDANASRVEIVSKLNELGSIESIEILDNGNGINFNTIDDTFGAFLVSEKSKIPKWKSIHGSKGKGRFSFISFASVATWNTVYSSGDVNKRYSITIEATNKDYINVTDQEIVDDSSGTLVSLTGLYGISDADINSKELKHYLVNIFSWFLYLNKDKGYTIILNGQELDYMEIIDDSISETKCVEIEDNKFKVNFIKWTGKIHEKYYYYFLDDKFIEKYKEYTSFNNNSINFPHSVYIQSEYFSCFEPVKGKIDENQIGFSKNQKDKVFTELVRKLKEIVENKRKKFIKEDASKIIEMFNKQGVMPKFRENKYDEERKKDLEKVVTEIYAIQPKIFVKSNIEQKKTVIGFLNLLLDTDERDGIINIMESITKLTMEEREELNNLLRKTSMTRIIRTIKMIENRYQVIESLKKLVYELNEFTNERDHIQKIVEENYWLFGEEYNLVTADKNFEKALKEYLYVVDDTDDKEVYKIENQERLRRPDIFMCRSRIYEMPDSIASQENVIIELKEPNVKLNKKVFRQIDDYMDLIIKDRRFVSQLRKWKFIMVSTTVDEYIKNQYISYKDKGRPFLVKWGEKFEIYAMTWDDVFKSFEIKHKYLLDKLQLDKSVIQDEIEDKKIENSRDGVNSLTNDILELEAQ